MTLKKKVSLFSAKLSLILSLENAFAEDNIVEEKNAIQTENVESSQSYNQDTFHSKAAVDAIKRAEERRNRRALHHDFANR